MIDTDIRTKWDTMQTNAQQRWSKLTHDDIDKVRGDIDRLVAVVQERYGYTTERAQMEVDKFLTNYDRKVHQVVETLPGHMDEKLMRRPWASMATAFVLGLATGWLAKAENHSHSKWPLDQ